MLLESIQVTLESIEAYYSSQTSKVTVSSVATVNPWWMLPICGHWSSFMAQCFS